MKRITSGWPVKPTNQDLAVNVVTKLAVSAYNSHHRVLYKHRNLSVDPEGSLSMLKKLVDQPLIRWAIVIPMLLLTATGVNAQQTTSEPCSPNATTTIEGKLLPPPP